MSLLSTIKGWFNNKNKKKVRIYQDENDSRITRVEIPKGVDSYMAVSEYQNKGEDKMDQYKAAVEIATFFFHDELVNRGKAEDNEIGLLTTFHRFLHVHADGSYPLVEAIADSKDLDNVDSDLYRSVAIHFSFQDNLRKKVEPYVNFKTTFLGNVEKEIGSLLIQKTLLLAKFKADQT